MNKPIFLTLIVCIPFIGTGCVMSNDQVEDAIRNRALATPAAPQPPSDADFASSCGEIDRRMALLDGEIRKIEASERARTNRDNAVSIAGGFGTALLGSAAIAGQNSIRGVHTASAVSGVAGTAAIDGLTSDVDRATLSQWQALLGRRSQLQAARIEKGCR